MKAVALAGHERRAILTPPQSDSEISLEFQLVSTAVPCSSAQSADLGRRGKKEIGSGAVLEKGWRILGHSTSECTGAASSCCRILAGV